MQLWFWAIYMCFFFPFFSFITIMEKIKGCKCKKSSKMQEKDTKVNKEVAVIKESRS